MYDKYLCTHWLKKGTVLKNVFIEHGSLLSVLVGSQQQSTMSLVLVLLCEMCSWPQASYNQSGQTALLPQLPTVMLEKGKISPPGHCHIDGAPLLFIHY